MSYQPRLTKEEMRVIKEALLEFLWCDEDGKDAVEYPIDREIAKALWNRLDMAYITEKK